MSFVFKKGQTYLWPVSLEIPVDGGKHEKKEFKCLFKRIEQSKIQQLLTDVQEGKATDKSFCHDVVAGWKDVKDAEGADLEFNLENLADVLDFPGFAAAVVTAYLTSMAGAKAKNL